MTEFHIFILKLTLCKLGKYAIWLIGGIEIRIILIRKRSKKLYFINYDYD